MMFPQKKENTKLSALKEFFKDYGFYILVCIIGVGVITLASALLIHFFVPVHTTQATVTAVGYKGVTVEYKGEYGQDCAKKINVDDVTEYQIGDTVTIEIKALNVEIVEERDNESN